MSYSFQNKILTISLESLTANERRTYDFCIMEGDSHELSLWTIEHIERKKSNV